MRRLSRSSALIWTVMLAVWMSAVAPAIGSWMAARSRLWVEVCSATGSRMVAMPSGSSRQDPATPQHKHCAFCTLHQDLAPGPSSAPWHGEVLLPLAQQGWQASSHLHQATAWAHRPAHAPPALVI